MKTHPLPYLFALLAIPFGLTGCSVLKPKADLTEFFVLRAPSHDAGHPALKEPALPEIRVGPGRIAGYLDNAKIAVQDGENRIDYLDRYRWAEPLSKGLGRTLSENLAQRLTVKHLIVYPDPALEPSGFEVRYTVHRFEGPVNGAVTLEVAWQVVEVPSSKAIADQRGVYVVPAEEQEDKIANYVKRLSDALAQWANDIAAAVPPPEA
jgi:uncharacterized lipoprotein YmbA